MGILAAGGVNDSWMSAPERRGDPQTFREWVSQGIETEENLGWEKKLLARWANRKKK